MVRQWNRRIHFQSERVKEEEEEEEETHPQFLRHWKEQSSSCRRSRCWRVTWFKWRSNGPIRVGMKPDT